MVEGKPTGVLAVKFFVKTKYPKASVRSALPKNIDGVPVDVEEAARSAPSQAQARRGAAATPLPNPRVRMRPAHAGLARSASGSPAISS